MAYLIDMSVGCDDQLCKSRAVVKLYDWRNEYRGKWCRKCGKRELRNRQKFEDNNAEFRFTIKRKKKLSDLTPKDITPGLGPEDIAIDCE